MNLTALLFLVATAAQPVDLVVRNGTVVTVDASRRVIAHGAVAVDGGRIAAVGTEAEVDAQFRGKEALDAAGGIVMPGLVNAHVHSHNNYFRGARQNAEGP